MPAAGSKSLIIRAAVFDTSTSGYKSLTEYSIDFGSSLQDAAGYPLAGLEKITFRTGDSHAPNITQVATEQVATGLILLDILLAGSLYSLLAASNQHLRAGARLRL
jgi:hypothetical protein